MLGSMVLLQWTTRYAAALMALIPDLSAETATCLATRASERGTSRPPEAAAREAVVRAWATKCALEAIV